jgi:putative ABC transport system permease protein
VLGIIRLMGFSGADIVCFPLMQTLFTSALGMGLAFALYAAVAGVINALFPLGAELGAVCRLSWAHVGGAAGVVLALSLLAALPPSLSCSRLSPSEVIRNE